MRIRRSAVVLLAGLAVQSSDGAMAQGGAATAPAATPSVKYFRYARALQAPGKPGQTCVALDAATFAHAAAGLRDVRLYRGAGDAATETAYVVRQAVPPAPQQKVIPPLNLGKHHGPTSFEAVMPAGRYSDIDLDITAKNFIATVAVTGSQTETGTEGTELGMFTIFDLTGQKLGRSTVLHLPESDFRYLYFAITGPVKPEDVEGLSVERVPAKQRFVTVAATDAVTQKGRESQVTFTVPAHVPVERVEFVVGAQPANFSRDVTVRVEPAAPPKRMTEEEPAQPAESTGNLLRVHEVHNGIRIDEEHLAVDAPWVDFGARDSQWTVTIENGDDAPLAITGVHLEVAERQMCFDATAGASYTLDYGDAALAAPQYDYATLFVPDKDAAQATLGPEERNPEYRPRPDQRPFTERHPGLLWLALILVVLVLGGVALRTARDKGKTV
jgi:hypothetical protein